MLPHTPQNADNDHRKTYDSNDRHGSHYPLPTLLLLGREFAKVEW